MRQNEPENITAIVPYSILQCAKLKKQKKNRDLPLRRLFLSSSKTYIWLNIGDTTGDCNYYTAPGYKSCTILIPTRTNTHADTCTTEQRIPPSIIVAIMLDREKKSLLFCTPTPSVDLLLLECWTEEGNVAMETVSISSRSQSGV